MWYAIDYEVLYLYDHIILNSTDRKHNAFFHSHCLFLDITTPSDLRIEDLNLEDSTASSESDSEYSSHKALDHLEQTSQAFVSPSRQSVYSTISNASDLEFPRPKSVSLHKHMTYEEYRQLQYEKFKRAGALGVLGKDK